MPTILLTESHKAYISAKVVVSLGKLAELKAMSEDELRKWVSDREAKEYIEWYEDGEDDDFELSRVAVREDGVNTEVIMEVGD